jgi:hypothetical protein
LRYEVDLREWLAGVGPQPAVRGSMNGSNGLKDWDIRRDVTWFEIPDARRSSTSGSTRQSATSALRGAAARRGLDFDAH